jgi:hypothetical protein
MDEFSTERLEELVRRQPVSQIGVYMGDLRYIGAGLTLENT